MRRDTYYILFTWCFLLASINLFEPKFLPQELLKYARFLFLLTAIILSLPYLFGSRGGFAFSVKLITLSIIVSIFAAYISWEQGILDSLKSTVPFLLWPVFFYIQYLRVPVEKIEKIIITLGLIYVCLFFFQFFNSSRVYFGWAEEFVEDRGIIRIVFPGAGVFFFTIFLALNRYSAKSKYRMGWLLLAILGIIVPVMQVTRQTIAAVLVIYLFHFIKDRNIVQKVFILASFIAILVYVSYSENPVIQGLLATQDQTLDEGKDYIRVVAANYFVTEFSPNSFSQVAGNGVPYGSETAFGQFERTLWSHGIFLSDVGIVAVYAMFGVLGVLGFIILWIKSFTLKLPQHYYHLKYYLWYLLATCLTSNYLYHYNYLGTTVLVLYCYQIVHKKYIQQPEKPILNQAVAMS